MKRCSKSRIRTDTVYRRNAFHPRVVTLESRLQPGDAVLSGLMGLSLAGSGLSLLVSDLLATTNAVADAPATLRRQVRADAVSLQATDYAKTGPLIAWTRSPTRANWASSTQVATPSAPAIQQPVTDSAQNLSVLEAAALASPTTAALWATDGYASLRTVNTAFSSSGIAGLPASLDSAHAAAASIRSPFAISGMGLAGSRVGNISATRGVPHQAHYQLPLSFEPNLGQANASIQFLARGSGYNWSLTSQEAVVTLGQTAAAPTAVHMQLVGANAAAQGFALQQLPGKVTYVNGSNPSQWHANVPTFARVEYQDVYAGINLDYYSNHQQLEYDFTVAPGADPRGIRLNFTGTDHVTVDGQGNLVLDTAAGPVVQHRPVVYQIVDGVRHEINAGFTAQGQQAGFQVGAYDASRPLVIDPTVQYASFYGGPGADVANAIAADSSGDAYLAGQADFGSGPVAFAFELDPTGQTVLQQYSVSNAANAYGITLDSSGNVYVTGVAPTGQNPIAFATKFDAFGNPVYSNTVPSTFVGYGVASDSGGNAYITGADNAGGGASAAFIDVLNPSGSVFRQTGPIGSTIVGFGIGVDASGNAYVTGEGSNGGHPIGFVARLDPNGGFGGAFLTGTLTGNGIGVDSAGDAYLAVDASGSGGGAFAVVEALDPTGSHFLYPPQVIGAGQGQGVAVDAFGDAYVTGALTPDGQTFQSFVQKFDPSGNPLFNPPVILAGSGGLDAGLGIAVDNNGNSYVAGLTNSPDFPVVNPIQGTHGGGQSDAFFAKISDM